MAVYELQVGLGGSGGRQAGRRIMPEADRQAQRKSIYGALLSIAYECHLCFVRNSLRRYLLPLPSSPIYYIPCQIVCFLCLSGAVLRTPMERPACFLFPSLLSTPCVVLQAMGPPYGVVGPESLNNKILVHDFTHRLHMDIFDQQYYPASLTDW